VADHDTEMTERTPEERRADHAAMDRLADELLPVLVAKLGASGLGELEVREGGWRIRLRMPADARAARRASGPGRGGHPAPATHPTPAARAAPSTRPAEPAAAPAADPEPPTRTVATSPAVGFYRPRPELAAGARVRAGDRLGVVDVLGVPQEVVSPADGIVGVSLVEPGDPVEYGQGILEIELLAAPSAAAPATATASVLASPEPPGAATRSATPPPPDAAVTPAATRPEAG
jgi:acetyl-CoA carboxylase biotin carboxyl carrier protein